MASVAPIESADDLSRTVKWVLGDADVGIPSSFWLFSWESIAIQSSSQAAIIEFSNDQITWGDSGIRFNVTSYSSIFLRPRFIRPHVTILGPLPVTVVLFASRLFA